MNQGLESAWVEVHVREGGKEGLHGETVDPRVAHAHRTTGQGEVAEAPKSVREQVLEGGDLGALTAHAADGARVSVGRLFTLVAVHGLSSEQV